MHLFNDTDRTGQLASSDSPDTAETSIFAVVVLYKVRPEESVTLRTLFKAAEAAVKSPLRLCISIHDNTPGGQEFGELPNGVRYHQAACNSGLALAYNVATSTASDEGYQWLLTLDQDTDLPAEFLTTLLRHAERYAANDRVAAIVPHIFDGERHVSPLRFIADTLPVVLSRGSSGVAPPFTTALNSASLLRVSALQLIGGYDERFPLHNSDTSLFHRLGKADKLVAVAGDLAVRHQLAIMDRQERMSVDRYRLLLADERAFWDLHMNFFGRVERLLRLVARIGRDLVTRRNKDFREVSLQEAWFRMTTRRQTRVKLWERGKAGP